MGSPFGTWQTMTIRLPAEVEELTQAIDTVGQFVVNVYNVSLQLLNLMRAASIGYIDPIQALLNAVIKEVEKQFDDLSELGFFLTGDWELLRFPFDDLLGGYQGYERRMVARLTDRTDPTRPDVSEANKVFGMFLFVSADASNVKDIANLVTSFQKFFSKPTPGSQKMLATPGKLEATYGAEGVPVHEFQRLGDLFKDPVKEPPTVARITWTTPASTGKNPDIPFTYPAPDGFLVEVSTVASGLSLFYERPQADADTVRGKDGKKTVQIRESGPVLGPDGTPLVVFGGWEQLSIDASLQYNATIDGDGDVLKGRPRIFGLKAPNDKNPIPLDLLRTDNGEYLLQRTFYVSSNEEVFFPGTSYGITINHKDLPFDADFKEGSDGKIGAVPNPKKPDTYYVRVAAVSKEIRDEQTFVYEIAANRIKTPGKAVQAQVTSGTSSVQISLGTDRGELSEPLTLTFPDDGTQAYLDTIAASLVVLVLARADLPVVKTPLSLVGQPEMAKTATGLEGLASIVRRVYLNPTLKYGEANVQPLSFRNDLLNRCRKVAADLYKTNGPNPKLEKIITDKAAKILTWRWADSTNPELQKFAKDLGERLDMTILDSLETSTEDEGGDSDFGLGLTPWNVGTPEDIVSRDFFTQSNEIMGNREPAFYEILEAAQELPPDMTEEQAKAQIKKYPNLVDFIQSLRRKVKVAGGKGKTKIVYQVPEAYSRANAARITGSADHSPVFFSNIPKNGKVFFCRNIINQDIYDLAAMALNLAAASLKRPTADGEWIATKVFWAFPPVKQVFDTIINWLKTFQGGNKAITDALENYINMVEARILETQELIQRLLALIQTQLIIEIPAASGLVLVESGTEGILTGLVTASNKPQDAATAYGGGVCLLAAGAPSILIDFLMPLIPGV